MLRSRIGIYLLALTLFATVAVASHATGTSEKAPIPTITFVTQETPSSPALAAQIAAYKAYIEGVKDKYHIVFDNSATGDTLKSKIRIAMASNSLPDAFWYWAEPADSSDLVNSGLLLNVNDYFATTTLKKDDFSNWESMMSKDGNYYAIPIQWLDYAWLANKQIFDELNLPLPKTFQDIINAAPTFKAHGIIPIATGSKGGNPGHTLIDMIFLQYPGAQQELKDIIAKHQLNGPIQRKSLQLVAELRDAGAFPADTVSNGDWGPTEALYNTGKAAMLPTLSTHISGASPQLIANTVFIDCPTVAGGVLEMSKYSFGTGLTGYEISKKSWNDPAKQPAIKAWTDFYLSPAMFQARFNNEGYFPTLKTMTVDFSMAGGSVPLYKKMLAFDKGKTVLNVMSHAVSMPNAAVWADYQAFLDGFFAGTMSVDQYLEKIQASIAAHPTS